jgi:hypothetical protein
MSMSTVVSAIVVLGINKDTPVSVLIEIESTVTEAMMVNKATFAAPVPALATVSAASTTLAEAQAAFKSGTGSRAARDDARMALMQLMLQLRVYVQSIVSAHPAQATAIAQAAAMRIRRPATHHKSDLAVQAIASGSVKIVAKALKGARAYEFAYSPDGGKTWLSVLTTKASAFVTGLVPGTTVTYRHRAITKTGAGDWSQPVTAVVM